MYCDRIVHTVDDRFSTDIAAVFLYFTALKIYINEKQSLYFASMLLTIRFVFYYFIFCHSLKLNNFCPPCFMH